MTCWSAPSLILINRHLGPIIDRTILGGERGARSTTASRAISAEKVEMSTDPSCVAAMRGLSDIEAQARLRTEGYNELPRPDRRTPLRIIIEVMREPMLAPLIGSCATRS